MYNIPVAAIEIWQGLYSGFTAYCTRPFPLRTDTLCFFSRSSNVLQVGQQYIPWDSDYLCFTLIRVMQREQHFTCRVGNVGAVVFLYCIVP